MTLCAKSNLRGLSRGRKKSSAGLSVIEVLIAMGIFSIAVLGLVAGTTNVIRANHTSYLLSIATNLAQDKLEDLKGRTIINVATCSASCDSPIPTYQSVPFTRTWTVTTDSPVAGVTQVSVTVQWTDYESRSVTLASVIKQ